MLNSSVYKEQRVAILIDVQNMYYSAKNLYNSKVNFVEILNTALRGRRLIRAVAYTIKADVKDEKNFHEALEKIGFEVRTKDLLVFHGGHKKGDWDVGIAMDAVRAAEKVDVIVVVSGDGDFKEMYEYVRGKGCRIEVIAFSKTASSSIKGYVDAFVDMDKDKKYLIPLGGKQSHVNKSHGTAKKTYVNKPNVNTRKPHANISKPHVNVSKPRVNISKPNPHINKPVVNKSLNQGARELSLQEINAQQPESKPATAVPNIQKKATPSKTPVKKKAEEKKEGPKKKHPFIKKILGKAKK